VYANPRKPVPLEPRTQPIALTIPRDGRLVPVGRQETAQPSGAIRPVLRPDRSATSA